MLGALDCFVDCADHVECLLRQFVVLTVENLSEASHGFAYWHEAARRAGEHFGNEEGLREETLYLARPSHNLAVFVRKLLNAQNRDDVLQVRIALENLLHAARHIVVFLTDDGRFKDAGERCQRVNGWVQALRGKRALKRDNRV